MCEDDCICLLVSSVGSGIAGPTLYYRSKS
jgi:hypothetical protein